ncbi:tyrosyl-tRNA deacylase [Clostridium novyi B str. ATCC 27606]|uniref:D-aminoacyl-tRNA deacylase n=2 Tax=Clostridium TaxID=1485 RepID=A0A9P2G705_CLOBO|nr:MULTISPECIES: D-aminoacyl-tRNA deacylase [Clostridium]EES91201.1 D-tyrosyl-tRNA(Tyr) deacylase [Clostridium botulinum D str. 1873]KEI13043.1 tyrosyl-tRNA deacylase [Clostridium novyi B str. NCTC 9691]KEI15846.1 tyrosyl-tRNA deacylase [Clostridium novyi B str. ATCC 27606]MBO3442027.1 D-tyrosyl-tRNA(Tyr) deacylase [Clostridium haemolyticum]NFV47363.1 D-tyrosyl-tRNA(Tyr) deacylase [Clostridium botulinum]
MRAIVQRVKESSVSVDGKVIGKIGIGFNVLLGISKEDTIEDVKYIKKKIINLRVFEDENGKMNKSLKDVNGELLIVSQFTLYGDCRKGNRPNFMQALGGEEAKKLYLEFINMCKEELDKVETGEFGAHMLVDIKNHGPVTLIIDSKKIF